MPPVHLLLLQYCAGAKTCYMYGGKKDLRRWGSLSHGGRREISGFHVAFEMTAGSAGGMKGALSTGRGV